MAGQNLELNACFNGIYSNCQSKVLAFVTAKCRDPEDVRDIVQNIWLEFFALLQKRGTDYARSPEALAMQIAKQQLARHYSLAERLRLALPARAPREETDGAEEAILATDTYEIDDAVANDLLCEEIRRRLAEKSAQTRKAFALFFGCDLTIAETAALLGWSESKVKNHLYRTLQELRLFYTEKG
ncbi:MAG: RNA polymerase sigma factor [Oscillospiraceae bacterium]|jgi:RNA polymerase sigma-70 factor (ECF subfamily)|nr:RNA polymerase sigma factor [Oscillospiraceae bacterium]